MTIKNLIAQFAVKAFEEKPTAQYFRKSKRGLIKLSENVIFQLMTHAQINSSTPESGGVMLGRYIVHSRDVVVDSITTPSRSDIQSRFRFFRSLLFHQKAIDVVWADSKGRYNYLGEWHSHPEPDPTPSSIDMADWIRRLKNDTFDSDSLFFVIVGTRTINVWEGTKGKNIIKKLQVRRSK